MNCTIVPRADSADAEGHEAPDRDRTVVLHPGEFLGATLVEEADRLGVTKEQLVTFAVLYYLADLDRERTARRVPSSITRAAG
ncbi:MAG: hypothetical protein QOI18_144 [Solirubrobacteraceae bacterium]|nr:hypothetical protein [Solirubrobacteraceae bacterium]